MVTIDLRGKEAIGSAQNAGESLRLREVLA